MPPPAVFLGLWSLVRFVSLIPHSTLPLSLSTRSNPSRLIQFVCQHTALAFQPTKRQVRIPWQYQHIQRSRQSSPSISQPRSSQALIVCNTLQIATDKDRTCQNNKLEICILPRYIPQKAPSLPLFLSPSSKWPVTSDAPPIYPLQRPRTHSLTPNSPPIRGALVFWKFVQRRVSTPISVDCSARITTTAKLNQPLVTYLKWYRVILPRLI